MEKHCRLRSLFGSCNGEPDRDNRNLSTSGSTSGSFHDEAFNGTAGYAGEAARDGDFYGGTSASFSETGLHGGADCTDARSCKNGNCTSVYPGVHRPDCGGNRKNQGIMTEVSTRAMLALVRASQCYAAMQGRTYVIPDDVKLLAPCVLAHRLLTYGSTKDNNERMKEIVATVEVPVEDWKQ